MEYSMAIADEIKEFLTEDDWHFTFDEDRGLFRFGLGLKGKLKKINYVVDVKDDGYIVYAISPLGADREDPQMMANMAEFICRANYGLIMGNFEFDYDDGEIRFKVHICCEGDMIPNTEMIRRSIYCPAAMYNRYSAGILEVLFQDMNGKDAVKHCEKHSDSELRDMLTQLLNGDVDLGDNLDTVTGRLAELAKEIEADDDDDDTDDES